MSETIDRANVIDGAPVSSAGKAYTAGAPQIDAAASDSYRY
jgi:hypothetical protein